MRSAFRLNLRTAGDGFLAVSCTRMFCAVGNRARLTSGIIALLLVFTGPTVTRPKVQAQTPEGSSSRAARKEAVRALPLHKLNANVRSSVKDVVEHPSFYRRMPSQSIECDPQMFDFLVRRPEVMVNIWQVMGITKVTAQRSNPYSFFANDGAGTICQCDLIYSSGNLHIYYGDGSYDGSMAPRKVTGKCVCVLRSTNTKSPTGEDQVSGTMDVFLKLDNFGADLLARSVGPFVGKTADYNFTETAKFIAQISQICQKSPAGAMALAGRLDSLQPSVRNEFTRLIAKMGGYGNELDQSALANRSLANQAALDFASKAANGNPGAQADRGLNGRSPYDAYVASTPARGRAASTEGTTKTSQQTTGAARLRFTDSQNQFGSAATAKPRADDKPSSGGIQLQPPAETALGMSLSSPRQSSKGLQLQGPEVQGPEIRGLEVQGPKIRGAEMQTQPTDAYVQSDWKPIPRVQPKKKNIYMRR